MFNCEYCKGSITDISKPCPGCGARQVEGYPPQTSRSTSPTTTPWVGQQVEVDKYCPYHGKQIIRTIYKVDEYDTQTGNPISYMILEYCPIDNPENHGDVCSQYKRWPIPSEYINTALDTESPEVRLLNWPGSDSDNFLNAWRRLGHLPRPIKKRHTVVWE